MFALLGENRRAYHTKEEALEMLRKNVPFRKERAEKLKLEGYPAYTTAVSLILIYKIYRY